ncbi:MAG: hypothetical protein SGILL_002052 [Bacillariaceae sp.]
METALKPTPSPSTLLTASPSSTGPIQILTFNATGDTYFYRQSAASLTNQPSPDEETILIRKGLNRDIVSPDAFALVSFPDKDLTGSGFGQAPTESTPNTRIKTSLCLKHVPKSEDVKSASASTYTLCRLALDSVATAGGNDIDLEDPESDQSGDLMNLRIPDDCMGTKSDLVEFQVSASDDIVCMDISRLLTLSASAPEKRQTGPIIFENEAKDSIFMIDNLGPEQQQGDEFFTINSAYPPQLIFDQVTVDPIVASPVPLPPSQDDPEPSNSPSTQTPGASIDDTKSKGLYGLFVLLFLIPMLLVCLFCTRKRGFKNRDEQQTVSFDTQNSADEHEVREISVPAESVQLVSQNGSHSQDSSELLVDGNSSDDSDESTCSESEDGDWESEDSDADDDDNSSGSCSSGDEDTDDSFDDEGFSADFDALLLDP